jgi:hypothetical protein
MLVGCDAAAKRIASLSNMQVYKLLWLLHLPGSAHATVCMQPVTARRAMCMEPVPCLLAKTAIQKHYGFTE